MTAVKGELTEAIYQQIARWNVDGVEPTHIVASWDVVESLALEDMTRWFIGHDAFRLWGLLIVIAPSLPTGTWAVATDRPIDADRVTSEPRVVESR